MFSTRHFHYYPDIDQPGIQPWGAGGPGAEPLALYIRVKGQKVILSGQVLKETPDGRAMIVRIWGYCFEHHPKQLGLYRIHQGVKRVTCVPIPEETAER